MNEHLKAKLRQAAAISSQISSLVSATESYVNSCSVFFNKFHFLGYQNDLNIKLKIKFSQVCYFKKICPSQVNKPGLLSPLQREAHLYN